MIVKEINVKDVIAKSNLPVCDYSVNPYTGCEHACKYCYASFMKRFTGHTEEWGGFLDIKNWGEIKNPMKYSGKKLFIGSVTDPYQEAERTCQRTRALLMQLQGSGAKLTIQTKSDLILRDLELIKTFPGARVGFSINTLDEAFRRDMDNAVSIGRRIAAMRAFHNAGIRTTCFISPIFPGITDVEAIITECKDICNLIWLENLNLRGSCKPVIREYIAEKHPGLAPLYHDIYGKGDRCYWENLDREMHNFAEEKGLRYLRDDDSVEAPFDAPPLIVNYFYHEEIKKVSKKGGGSQCLSFPKPKP